jgi:uncharacterized membrane protein
MFLQTPFNHPTSSNIQHTVLILNTVLLIAIFITIEIAYAEQPKEKKRHLYYLYPFMIILVGILGLAVFQQIGNL